MRISIDNRQTDCLYVDKANLHTADATEIIKFIIKDDIADKVDLYINFIAKICIIIIIYYLGNVREKETWNNTTIII